MGIGDKSIIVWKEQRNLAVFQTDKPFLFFTKKYRHISKLPIYSKNISSSSLPRNNQMWIISKYKKVMLVYRQSHKNIRHLFERITTTDKNTIELLWYSSVGKTSVQSSEFDAKSDTNEIKLMVTDHADGNRIPFCIIHHCATTIPTTGLNIRETRIVLFYSIFYSASKPPN